MSVSTLFHLYRGVLFLLVAETNVVLYAEKPSYMPTVIDWFTNFITQGCMEYDAWKSN